jgi:hypothetical protein
MGEWRGSTEHSARVGRAGYHLRIGLSLNFASLCSLVGAVSSAPTPRLLTTRRTGQIIASCNDMLGGIAEHGRHYVDGLGSCVRYANRFTYFLRVVHCMLEANSRFMSRAYCA